ncbi:hypothetical protein BEN44_20885 [Leptospira interrogans serovar Ricardi]|nr:hypothetical protein [Leptospira interrogans serovar Ricardi]
MSFRCSKKICEFSDLLFPNYLKTNSKNIELSGHDSIFFVKDTDVSSYIEKYSPIILRYNKQTLCSHSNPYNFGVVKGLTFDRVLIFPNKPLNDYLKTSKQENLNSKTKSKVYIAITRARFSVAFVYNGRSEHSDYLAS